MSFVIMARSHRSWWACSDARQSSEKFSVTCYLLEHNTKADLTVMIATAEARDEEVISFLHQHGAPVNGFITGLG